MAVNSETEINLKTLQRVDSNIIEIIDNASQVAIYKYERKLNKWEGTDIEGTLFLYKRSLHPFHGFIIVNRMSTTNFVEAITSDMEFVQHEPYFLYKKSCGEIIGSWFYEKKDFRRITNKIQSIVLKQTTPPKRQRCSSDSDSQLKKDDTVQDIMSMLSEANIQYLKTEKNPPAKRNIEEDFNNLSNYTDKKITNKSLYSGVEKSKVLSTRASSEEKYPASPRRRFLSSGSYDPSYPLTLSSNKIIDELVSRSGEVAVLSETDNPYNSKDESPSNKSVQSLTHSTFKNKENSSAKLSSFFNTDDILSSTLSGVGILDKSVESVEVPLNLNFQNSVIPKLTSEKTIRPDMMNGINKKAEYDMHSSDLKETLISHIKWDNDIMLKIHEAYAASLKSLFVQKKN